MGSTRGRRPSPALVVSILALLVAVSGTAVAASALSKAEKKQVKGIAANQVNKLAPGLSVAKATTADSAGSAKTADSATTAGSATTANSATTAGSATTADSATTAANAQALQGTSLAQVAPGEFGFNFSCVLDGMFQTCATVDLTLDRPADVFVVLTAQWFSPDVAGTSVRAHCMIRLGPSSTSNVSMGSTANDTDGNQWRSFAMSGQFPDTPAGTSTFELRCVEDEGNVTMTENRMFAFVVTS